MAYSMNLTSSPYNGAVENDELALQIDNLSNEELDKLLNDAEEIKRLAKNSTEVKKSISTKEACMEENKRLAEANLAMEPEFLTKKQELAQTYKELSNCRKQYQTLNSEIDALGTNYSPDAILALLQAANAETEEESEKLSENFMAASIKMEDFVNQFIPLRQLFNERRWKIEKLSEALSRGQSVNITRPTFNNLNTNYGRMSDSPRVDGGLYPNFGNPDSYK